MATVAAAVGQTPSPTSAPVTTQPAASLQTAHELWVSGQYAEAERQYRALADSAETSLPARIGLAQCDLMSGQYRDALAELDQANEGVQQSAEWNTLRAELLTRLGSYQEAIQHARRALDIDPQLHRARRLLGELLELTGQREEAIDVYSFFDRLMVSRRTLPPAAEDITEAAKGFYRYSVLTRHPLLIPRTKHVLGEWLQEAYGTVDRSYWPARLAAADLLLSKYKLEQAAEDYEAALKINPNLPEAHVGLGRVAMESWQFEEVERRVSAALAINPNCTEAFALRARSEITQRRYDDGLAACEQALAVNPNHIEALALAAAAHRCKYDLEGTRRYEQRALEINPRCATLYSILGDALSGLRQYADSEAAYRKAIEFDPTDANPRTELGMMYMQWGLEDRAREALDAAWELDNFNARTFNTLELLERLEAFGRYDTEHFVICYDEATDWPIVPYLASAAEDIYEDVCADYETELPQKTIIELLPTHRDFGVRITGKPWIYTIGACTGWVIALDSPREHPQTQGPYHYARVLRHEFIHTVTLALTHNRISHWYTEGLAVHGEDAPRSSDWCRLLSEAIRQGRLFTLESIDWGFVRPKRRDDRQLAYAQSEWMVEYIIHRYGYDALSRMLEGFAQAKPQPQVFRDALGIELHDFDRDFAAWAHTEAEGWGFDLTPAEDADELREAVAVDPDNAALVGRLARAELDEGDFDQAVQAARQALELDEREVNALTVMVQAMAVTGAQADSEDDRRQIDEAALPLLRRLAEVDPQGWTAPKLLGDIALRRKEYDQAVDHLQQLQRLCPLDPASYSGLAGIYLERGDAQAALPQLLELARMDQHDSTIPAHIAGIFARQDRLGEARYWYSQSLYINPYLPQTHQKLAEVLMRSGDTKSALTEYEVLCRLEPNQARHFADAAFAYHKLGDAENARSRARRAVELDPASPARTLLDSTP